MLGTLGPVVTALGLWLVLGFDKSWAVWIAFAGGVMLALSLSFTVLSGSRREDDEDH